jgi:hypothetical protein
MLEPRYSRLSSLRTSPIARQILPTGNGFGGSNFKSVRFEVVALPVIISSTSILDRSTPIELQSSPLLVEVGKIFLLACWLWCSIGANFCLNSVGAIVDFCTQDI